MIGGRTLARIRTLIQQTDPDVVEEVKWRKPSNGSGVRSGRRRIICTGRRTRVREVDLRPGASLPDPAACSIPASTATPGPSIFMRGQNRREASRRWFAPRGADTAGLKSLVLRRDEEQLSEMPIVGDHPRVSDRFGLTNSHPFGPKGQPPHPGDSLERRHSSS